MNRAVFAHLPLALLTACAVPQDNRSDLADSEWRFTTIDGQRAVSQDAKLSFESDRLGASVGCNTMGGAWRIEAERLIAGPFAQTEMYCEGPVWEQEKAVGALLAGAPQFSVKGDRMVLESSGHSAQLQRQP